MSDDALREALEPFVYAYLKAADPGTSDLDNEQPFHITVPLGACRRASAVHAAAISAPPSDVVGEIDNGSLSSVVCSDAALLAREINDDVMGGEAEIAAAIQRGFDIHRSRVIGEIVAWHRAYATQLRQAADKLSAGNRQTAKRQLATAHERSAGEISRRFGGGAGGWQPIETAPKDGTRILALYGEDNRVDVVTWFDATSRPFWRSIATATVRGERYMRKSQPLYWRPLPPPPEDGE